MMRNDETDYRDDYRHNEYRYAEPPMTSFGLARVVLVCLAVFLFFVFCMFHWFL